MDESDLDELHEAILDELHDGRVTPSLVADETGESRQLMQSRLRDLVMGGHVEKVHKGLYQLVDDPRPSGAASDPSLEDALDGVQTAERYCEGAGLDDLGSDLAELYQRLGQEADWDGGGDVE